MRGGSLRQILQPNLEPLHRPALLLGVNGQGDGGARASAETSGSNGQERPCSIELQRRPSPGVLQRSIEPTAPRRHPQVPVAGVAMAKGARITAGPGSPEFHPTSGAEDRRPPPPWLTPGRPDNDRGQGASSPRLCVVSRGAARPARGPVAGAVLTLLIRARAWGQFRGSVIRYPRPCSVRTIRGRAGLRSIFCRNCATSTRTDWLSTVPAPPQTAATI